VENASDRFMEEAIALAVENVRSGRGGPFAALVVREGAVLASGVNLVTTLNDPTAHAEVVAIRRACTRLRSFSLAGCILYTSCEPCPMCLGAAYWARLDRLVFAAGRLDAAAAGFDDAFIYDELPLGPLERSLPTSQLLREEAIAAFDAWLADPDRVPY